MDLSPLATACIAFGALVPFAIYAFGSGELTAATAVAGVTNILLISVSVVVLFGSDTDRPGSESGAL